jgi:hypothetical protein
MSTTFTLKCTSGTATTLIQVTHSIIPLPFQDTWAAVTPADWDVPGGNATNLGQPVVFLSNGTGTPHQLDGFGTNTQVNDTGTGIKNTIDEGNFPGGNFNWVCTAVA